MRFREITEAKNETRTKGKLKDGTPVNVFVKQEPEKITVWIKAGNEFLGSAYFVKADFAGRQGKWVATSTFINTEWRRQGANSLMYDAVEKLGYELIPEPRVGKLSNDGAAFWRSRKIHKGRVNEKLIDNPVTQKVLQARREMKMSPWAINNGWCMAFALRLARKLGDGAELVSTTGVPGGFPGHSVVRYKGKFYDVESPEGVDSIPELAYCKRLRAIADQPGEEDEWLYEAESEVASIEEWDKSLPLAGPVVSGLRVRNHIDNLGSIEASFEDYVTLKGIREVPFSLFTGPDGMTRRIEALMADIEESGEITPFIVAIDSHNGPYILEGAHRYDALQYLDKPTFPALIVFDNDDGYFGDSEA